MQSKKQWTPQQRGQMKSEKSRTLEMDSLELSEKPGFKKGSSMKIGNTSLSQRIKNSVGANLSSQKRLFIFITILFVLLLLMIILAVTLYLAEHKVYCIYIITHVLKNKFRDTVSVNFRIFFAI